MRSVESVEPWLPRSRISIVLLPVMAIEVEEVRLGISVSRSFGGKVKAYTNRDGSTSVITIDELLKTRTLDESLDGQRSYTRTYQITGTKDPLLCTDLGPQVGTAHENDPTLIVSGRRFSVMATAENQYDACQLVVTYTQADQPENGGGDTDAGFSYEFSTESEHVDTAINQTNSPDNENLGNLINFGPDDQIEGVDIFAPTIEINEEHSFRESEFTPAMRQKIASMVAKVNQSPFREWAAGEVLFLGASARKINKRWIVGFNFRIRRNRMITVSTVDSAGAQAAQTVEKKGWQYYWARAWRVVSNGKVITGMKSVHVADVYEEADFADFGFSTTPLP